MSQVYESQMLFLSFAERRSIKRSARTTASAPPHWPEACLVVWAAMRKGPALVANFFCVTGVAWVQYEARGRMAHEKAAHLCSFLCWGQYTVDSLPVHIYRCSHPHIDTLAMVCVLHCRHQSSARDATYPEASRTGSSAISGTSEAAFAA